MPGWSSGLPTSGEMLIRRQCRALQRPGHLAAGLPGWFSLACVVLHRCAALYGQNPANSRGCLMNGLLVRAPDLPVVATHQTRYSW